MTEEIIIDECFNCKKKKNIGDNWRICKLKCSYKYKRKENDYITRLERENKDFEILAKSLYKRIEELEKENEALAFRERLYKADYEASEQENKELKNKNICRETCEYFKRICNENTPLIKYRSALEEIRTYLNTLSSIDNDFPNTETYLRINDKIEEVLNHQEG